MKRKLVEMLCLISILSIMLIGCKNVDKKENKNNVNDTTQNEEQIKKEPVYGGEINIAITNPKTLNPILNEDNKVDQVLKLVFEPFFTIDDSQKPVPNLAENYQISPEGDNIQIKLKDNIFWQDGKPIISSDIAFTVRSIQNAIDNSFYSKCVDNIARVAIVNDKEVIIYYKQPSSMNLYSLMFPVIPEHYYSENMNLDSELNLKPLGNSYYSVESYETNKTLKLIRNDNCYKGKAYIDSINCIITADDETEMNLFKQNNLDLIIPNVYDWQEFVQNDNVKINEYISYYYDFIGFNFKNEILKDISIRKAIAYAIDRDKINKEIYLNHATITDFPIHPNSWLLTNSKTMYNYNISETKKLLEQAGYKQENDEIIFNLSLLINNNDLIKQQLAEEIKKQLQQIGIEVVIASVDYETYREKLYNGEYDIVLGGWKLAIEPDLTFAFHSKSIENASNFIFYNDEKMDELLANAYNSYTEEQIINSYNELNKYIQEQLPYYSLFFRNSLVISNENIEGNLETNTYFEYNNFDKIYKATLKIKE